MINKEVITKTQKRLIRINMLVVSGFLILLCMFTTLGVRFIKFSSYFYFSRSGNEENPEDGCLLDFICLIFLPSYEKFF